jgi:hypothetical protein
MVVVPTCCPTAHVCVEAAPARGERARVPVSGIVRVVTHLHPPIDIPMYGLDRTWAGPRWLDSLDGRAGHPVWGIWLGHGRDVVRGAGSHWVVIGSFSRDRSAPLRSRGETFEHGLAFDAARVLLGHTRDIRRIEMEADRWESWPTVAWRVDGQVVTARLLVENGRAWAGFTSDVPQMGLVIHGGGLDPHGLALARVRDSSSYHFAAESPLEYPTAIEASQGAALGL